MEAPFKDGEKILEVTFRDGERGTVTCWDRNGINSTDVGVPQGNGLMRLTPVEPR